MARAGVGPVGAEAHFRRPRADAVGAADAVEAAVSRLAETHEDAGAGAVITVDEAQTMERRNLNAFTAALQAGTEVGWPFAVVMAGLAGIRDTAAGVTYLEPGEWRELGFLDGVTTLAALTKPARQAGRPMVPAAAQHLAEQSGGHPYAIQVYGDSAWIEADADDHITLAHARAAAEHAEGGALHFAVPGLRRYVIARADEVRATR